MQHRVPPAQFVFRRQLRTVCNRLPFSSEGEGRTLIIDLQPEDESLAVHVTATKDTRRKENHVFTLVYLDLSVADVQE